MKEINGNMKLLKMVVKMFFHIILSALDIIEECKKFKI